MQNLKQIVEDKFVGGLVTDSSNLDEPEHVTRDEDNVDMDRKGSRRRRKGIMPEPGFVASTQTFNTTDLSTFYIKTYVWKSPANQSNLEFLIVQVGNTLVFYDKAVLPLSAGQKNFSVNLNTFAALGITDTSKTGIQVASGKGYLFVVGEAIDPFYITYNSNDTITTSLISLRVRDLSEQDITSANDAQPFSISVQRKYDLLNQGWGFRPPNVYSLQLNQGYTASHSNGPQGVTMTAMEWYIYAETRYPPKTKPWWVGKRIGDKGFEYFVPDDTYDIIDGGTTLAALGHFIIDPFNIDRDTVSGLTGLPAVVILKRPTAVAFHAGRVFYALGNKIYFSQIIEDDVTVVGKCYQEADPTAEHISDLVATDGGTFLVADSGDGLALREVDGALFFFSNNGVWAISGQSMQTGFSAIDFSVTRISTVGAVSSRSIVDVEGVPVWWSPSGIYMLKAQSAKFAYEAVNIVEKKVQLYYNAIPPLAKLYATGAYDTVQKRLIWLYNDGNIYVTTSSGQLVYDVTDRLVTDGISITDTTNRFFYNKILNFDLVFGAFFPYTISPLPSNSPSVSDVFNTINLILASGIENVLDVNDAIVTDNADENVTIIHRTFLNNAVVTSDTKYLVLGAF